MNILVLGSTGLLGSKIRHHLEKTRGDSDEIFAPSRAELDLLNYEEIERYFKSRKPELIYHVAAKVFGIGGNLRNPTGAYFHNAQIDLNILKASESLTHTHIVYAGTVASYGFPYKNFPLQESEAFDGEPHEAEYGYALAKRGTLSGLKLLEKQGHSFTYCLITNLFGPNDNFDPENGHVIPSIVAKAHYALENHSTLEIWGKSETTRDFLYSDDAASMISELGKMKFQGIINIASGIERSMKEITDVILSNFPGVQARWNSDKPVGIQRRSVDVSQLSKIGLLKISNFEQSVRETVDSYRKEKHA